MGPEEILTAAGVFQAWSEATELLGLTGRWEVGMTVRL